MMIVYQSSAGDVARGQFAIFAGDQGPADDDAAEWVFMTDGLVGVMPGGLLIYTANDYAPADIAIDLAENAPPQDADDWDEVSEIGLLTGGVGHIDVGDLEGGGENRVPVPPVTYRVRVSARYRDNLLDNYSEHPLPSEVRIQL